MNYRTVDDGVSEEFCGRIQVQDAELDLICSVPYSYDPDPTILEENKSQAMKLAQKIVAALEAFDRGGDRND